MDRAVIVTSIDPNYGTAAQMDSNVTRIDNTMSNAHHPQQATKGGAGIYGLGNSQVPQHQKSNNYK